MQGIKIFSIMRLIFLACVDYPPYLGMQHKEGISARKYIPVVIVYAVLLGGVMIVALFLLSLRQLTPGMPIVVSCSLALSAAFYSGEWEEDVATLALEMLSGLMGRGGMWVL
jgi:hypothetical protein